MSRRKEMIEMLIDNDMDTILSGQSGAYLYDLLSSGFKGYCEYTDEELVTEMNERDLWTTWFKETI